jgi:hypothetical protein
MTSLPMYATQSYIDAAITPERQLDLNAPELNSAPRLSTTSLDRVYFGDQSANWKQFEVGTRQYNALPRVRLLRDWATYAKGTVMVVYQQINDHSTKTANYRCVIESEQLPLGDLGGRTIPAEIAQPILNAKDAVQEAREEAKAEALRSNKYVKSRGTFIGTISDKEGPVSPHELADCHSWNGSNRTLRGVVDNVIANYPNVDSVCISGGYDGSIEGDPLKDFLDGTADYEPWVSSWDVDVWSRKSGWLIKV